MMPNNKKTMVKIEKLKKAIQKRKKLDNDIFEATGDLTRGHNSIFAWCIIDRLTNECIAQRFYTSSAGFMRAEAELMDPCNGQWYRAITRSAYHKEVECICDGGGGVILDDMSPLNTEWAVDVFMGSKLVGIIPIPYGMDDIEEAMDDDVMIITARHPTLTARLNKKYLRLRTEEKRMNTKEEFLDQIRNIFNK